eukprot:208387-Ditylum_brightwellii.AAC.1
MLQESMQGEDFPTAASYNNFFPGPQGEEHKWSKVNNKKTKQKKNQGKGGKTENQETREGNSMSTPMTKERKMM